MLILIHTAGLRVERSEMLAGALLTEGNSRALATRYGREFEK